MATQMRTWMDKYLRRLLSTQGRSCRTPSPPAMSNPSLATLMGNPTATHSQSYPLLLNSGGNVLAEVVNHSHKYGIPQRS